ncbi:hypothetical protein Tco_1355753 [Tanacetum coccineum]
MYPTHTKIINSTIGDDQIDSDIIFDSPNRNVNSGSIEKDTHVPGLCALEQLARNAYHKAEKQQIFDQKGFGLDNLEISLNVRDTEDTLDDASKNFVPQKELSAEQKYFPSSFIPSDKNSNATPSIPVSMPKSELCELEKQNDFLKDQLLEVSLKHEVELSVLLNHECVDNSLHAEIEQLKKKSIEIQEGLQARIKILEKDVQRESESMIKESVFSSVGSGSHLQTSLAKQSGVNSNKNVIAPGMYKVVTTHESQTNEAKHDLSSTGMNAASSVRRPMNRDSHVKNSVLANSKKTAKKVAFYVRKNKQTDITSKNVILNKENVIDVDVANASKAKNFVMCFLYAKYTTSVVPKPKIDVGSTSKANDKIVLWIVDSGCSKHITGDQSLLKNFIEKFMGTIRFGNDNFTAITCYGDYI